MEIVIVIFGLIAWAAYKGIKELLTPPAPPISVEDMEKHHQKLLSLPTPEARRKYLKNRKP